MFYLIVAVLNFFVLIQVFQSNAIPIHETYSPFLDEPKIVGGEEADPHQFPYHVAVSADGTGVCGGSLIRDDVVLTAAHCVDTTQNVGVIAGAHKIFETEPSQQLIISDKVIVHEKWNRTSNCSWNDIALVILPSKFSLNNEIQLIELYSDNDMLEDESATVSGWGNDSTNAISPVLRYVTSQIMKSDSCRLYYPFVLDSQMCLNNESGKGSCFGDSGGPLTIMVDGEPKLVGVVSFGNKYDCEKGSPSVYSRVSSFSDWINSNLP